MVVATLDLTDHVDATIAALNAYATVAGIEWAVYRAGEVPPLPPYPYIVVWPFKRNDGTERRLSDDSTTRAMRVLTEFYGTTANSCWAVESHIDTALHQYRLTVTGAVCGPMHFEPARGVGRDPIIDDLYSGMSGWTFVSTLQ